MSKQSKKERVPRLRFPEFRGEWKLCSLGESYFFQTTNSYSRDKLNYKEGLVKNIHYGDIHTKFSTLFSIENEIVPFINTKISLKKIKSENYCIEGDMIFADASEDLNDIGKCIEIAHLNNTKLLSGLHTLLARQKKKEIIVGFGGYLFQSGFIRNQIKKEAQGTKVLGISARRLLSIKINFPLDKKEQQKIADCLSSLDELISAHTKKLQILKDHKKGLMQQLFPKEGKRVPKLRFPEFRGKGEWEEKKLSNICNINPAKCNLPKSFIYIDLESVEEGKLLYTKKISKENSPSRAQRLLRSDDIIYQTVRPYQRNNLYCKFENKNKYVASTGYAQLRAFDSSVFLYQLIHASTFVKKVIEKCTGSNYPSITSSELSKINVVVPPTKEQQKIADCLLSLDELISAHIKKLQILKDHKKGLMQQLFPKEDS